MLRHLLKHAHPAPRYTSYPTAPVFSDTFTADDYLRLLEQPDRADRALSLYFHFPFCRHVCFYCACNVIYTANRKRMGTYLRWMSSEMDLVSGRLAGPRGSRGRSLREVRQLHFGGGTPCFASPAEIRDFWSEITDRFILADDAEISVELDPRETSDEHVAAYAACGFNRASLGVQDLDPAVQQAVNRIQPFEMIQALMGKLRSSGFNGINLDLIYGLPRQTVAGFERTIEAVLTLRPDRISLFHFAYLPELKQHQRLIDPAGLPDACERVKILTRAIEQLSAGGYVHIGMDHFALPGDELELAQREGRLHRNFQGYTTRGDCDLLGFGVSSIGDLGNAYVQNTRTMTNYVNALERNTLPVERGYLLTPEDEERRRIIRQLICHFTLEYDADFRRRYAAEFENLREFEADDLLVIEPRPGADHGADHLKATDTGGGCIKVTPAGKFVIRNICMVFDAYATDLRARGQRFSRSV